MKYRLLDLLSCPCGARLSLKDAVTKPTVPRTSFAEVKCRMVCGFRSSEISQGAVSPSDCSECYATEIVAGRLLCERGHEWPIVDGIPRFLPSTLAEDIKKTQATFSFEWKMFREGERNWGQDISFRRDLFLKGMHVDPQQLRGKAMLDAGCGSGALSVEMAKSLGLEVVAIDLAFGIEKAYQRNDSPFVHFIQGSVLELPVREQAFDFVYCAGVLVHLPDSYQGFKSIIRALKSGGRCFIWVYHPIDSAHHPNDLRQMLLYSWVRKNVMSRLPIRLQYALYLSLMPVFLAMQRLRAVFGADKNRRTLREKMQNLFDTFSPVYQNRHQEQEVTGWYSEQGFVNVAVAYQERYGFGVRGDLA
jgi:ubiquinone/menaquinone biosynthesis C-methylase UbiE/uncharacterized protein YbaR (Trm112 family)